MFEHFTHEARAAVVEARAQAIRLRADEILAEHLLLAVVAADSGISARLLRHHDIRPETLTAGVAPLGAGDDDALRSVGIDLSAVRARAEAAFGPGSLDRPHLRRRGRGGRRVPGGCHPRFSDPAKRDCSRLCGKRPRCASVRSEWTVCCSD